MVDSDGWRREHAIELGQMGADHEEVVRDFARLSESLGLKVNPVRAITNVPPFKQAFFKKDGRNTHGGWMVNVSGIGMEELAEFILCERKRPVPYNDPASVERRHLEDWKRRTGSIAMTTIEVEGDSVVTEHRLILRSPSL